MPGKANQFGHGEPFPGPHSQEVIMHRNEWQ
jgi:hypothetical protein